MSNLRRSQPPIQNEEQRLKSKLSSVSRNRLVDLFKNDERKCEFIAAFSWKLLWNMAVNNVSGKSSKQYVIQVFNRQRNLFSHLFSRKTVASNLPLISSMKKRFSQWRPAESRLRSFTFCAIAMKNWEIIKLEGRFFFTSFKVVWN